MKSSNLMDGWVGLFTKDVQTWGFVKFGWNLTKDGQNGANVKEDCLEFCVFHELTLQGSPKNTAKPVFVFTQFSNPTNKGFSLFPRHIRQPAVNFQSD